MMRSPVRRAQVALLAVAAALLGACGGSEEGETTDAGQTTVAGGEATAQNTTGGDGPSEAGRDQGPRDEQRVRAAIEALLVDPDNEYVCNEVLSEELVGTAYGDLRGCLNGRAAETLGESVRAIRNLEVDGDRATAVAIVDGGLYDRVPLDLAAVRDGDRWRIERFTADIPVGP
jgi:hypothetical protein